MPRGACERLVLPVRDRDPADPKRRHLDEVPPEELAQLVERECKAHTRRGTPCQREPLPGRDYCPSHKHLEEDMPIGEVERTGAEELELVA